MLGVNRQQALQELRRRGINTSQFGATPQLAQTGGASAISQQEALAELQRRGVSDAGIAQPQQQGGFLKNLADVAGDISAGGARAVQGVVNLPHNIAHLISPALAARVPLGSNVNFQKIFGVQDPGVVGQTIQNLAQIAPALVTGGETLPGQIASQAAFGATQAKDPVTGAIIGGLGPLTAEGVARGAAPIIKGGIKLGKALGASAPAKALLDHLGFGKSLEQNNISIASDIKNSYDNVKAEGGEKFNDAIGNIGDNPIYERAPTSGIEKPRLQTTGSEYLNLPKSTINSFDKSLSDQNSQFIKSPTVSNAHNLQADMGRRIGDLKEIKLKQGLTNDQLSDLHNLNVARQSLRNDLTNFIDEKHPDLAGKYQQATDFWRQNVRPYSENGKIRKIAFGVIKNPKSTQINSIFSNPEEDINTIRSHVGPDLDKKVLFSFAKKTPTSATPAGLVKNLETASDRGYESYLTPEILKRMRNIKSLTSIAPAAKAIAGATVGGLLGRGAGPIGEAFGATGGALVGGRLIGLGEKALPVIGRAVSPAARAAGKVISPSLRVAEAALLPSILRGNQ